MNENQQICFTDSAGKELFSLPDNGVLCLSYGNGDTHFSLCRFLDQTHTEIDGVKFGDLVTLIGQNGGECVTVEGLSELAEKLRYEFICNFGKRVPREFLRHGKVVEQMDYFA
mgnify:CR=1 FL=1